MEPLISVVIPAYNRAHTIAKALMSVQSQTYSKWEAIVVDDGSTDLTSYAVLRIAEEDNRIRLIRHSRNRGAQAARNTGIKSAKGTWVAFLDSDDEWLPDSLRVRFEKALKDKVAVVHSGCFIREDCQELKPRRVAQPSGRVYRAILAKENPMFPALMVCKSALEKIGYLDERIVSFQEWDTSIRLAKFYNFAFVPEPTFVYNFGSQDFMLKKYSLRIPMGYSYIVRKHLFSILAYAGPKALCSHYYYLAYWYKICGDHRRARISKLKGLLWLVLFPLEIISRSAAGKIYNK